MDSFFGIGISELFFIAVIALIVLGPERLPGALREVAKFIRTVRGLTNELMSQFGDEIKVLDELNPQNLLRELTEDPADKTKAKSTTATKPAAKPAAKSTTSSSTSSTSKPATTKPATPKPATSKPATTPKTAGASATSKPATSTKAADATPNAAPVEAGAVAAVAEAPGKMSGDVASVESAGTEATELDNAAAESTPATSTAVSTTATTTVTRDAGESVAENSILPPALQAQQEQAELEPVEPEQPLVARIGVFDAEATSPSASVSASDEEDSPSRVTPETTSEIAVEPAPSTVNLSEVAVNGASMKGSSTEGEA